MLSGTPIVNQSVVRVSVESNLKLIKISQNIKISLRRVGGSCVKTDGYQTAHTGHRTFEFCTDRTTVNRDIRRVPWYRAYEKHLGDLIDHSFGSEIAL